MPLCCGGVVTGIVYSFVGSDDGVGRLSLEADGLAMERWAGNFRGTALRAISRS
jgi:hypothetical protein